MFGLLLTAILNHFAKRKANSCPACVPVQSVKTIIFQSRLICPDCGAISKDTIPHDSCQFFYDCKKCRTF